MNTRKWILTTGIGTLVLLVFQQVGSAQQLNDSGMVPNYALAASSVNSSVPTLQESVLTLGQNEESCSDLCCEEDCCESCGDTCCCCWRVFGDFLYLRPRSVEVTYAVPFNGPATPPGDVPIQVGRLGMVDPDYEPGFRVGFERLINPCASVGATYTHFDSNTSDSISVTAPIVIRSMVIHPSTLNAAADWLSAQASYSINYKLADIDYRRIFACGECYSANWLVGVRYGHLDQMFRSSFVDIGTESIDTDITFDGGGIRLGLEGERRARCSGFLIYGKGTANFVAGDFSARYFQGSSVDPEIVNTSWKAGRIVSMLELELGIGWASPSGRLRFTGGYTINAWYNTVTTADFIGAVQRNDFTSLKNTMTFDGLVTRAELRF